MEEDFQTLIFENSSAEHFSPSQKDISLINAFIAWNNSEKNKFFYSIVSCSYEYCLITARKEPAISRGVFRGKRFYLDTNIIFRMAGVNKDERSFVIKTFVEKCNEVGIKLYYTNEVFDELYRVIDGQINYIRAITGGQNPVNPSILSSVNNQFENNDFYLVYYNWCKEAHNKPGDFMSFRNYLIELITRTLSLFVFIDVPNYHTIESEVFSNLSRGLRDYKTEKRPYRLPSEASLRTDINNLMYVTSKKPKRAESLWEINDYIVSADQIFTNWSRTQFAGVPSVMIPSTWLSIILKVSGRATSDDYKSYCLFMSLRHHSTSDDDIVIDTVNLMKALASRTVEKQLKERIITEIKTNSSEYTFDADEDYQTSVDKAFDKLLARDKMLQQQELEEAVAEQVQQFKLERENYEKTLSSRKTIEEYAKEAAQKRAARKVIRFREYENIRLGITIFFMLLLGTVMISLFFDIPVLHDMLIGTGKATSTLWTVLAWAFTTLTGGISGYFAAVWKYMASRDRESKLFKKYYRENLENLKFDVGLQTIQ
jgi:hypothetical protein